MIIGSGLIQSGTPAFGTLSADSSDSALLAGQDALVCVYDGANYLYFGKASGTWKTLWVDTTGGLLRGDGAGTYAVTLASDGPAPFDVAGAFATDTKAGSVANGTPFTHEADCLIGWTQTTVPSGGFFVFKFRMESATVYWNIYINSAGGIGLQENQATVRGFFNGPVSSGDKILIICDGITIKVYGNNTLLINYASATAAATAVAGNVTALGTGGAISDLRTWPRTLSGTAAAILNKASA